MFGIGFRNRLLTTKAKCVSSEAYVIACIAQAHTNVELCDQAIEMTNTLYKLHTLFSITLFFVLIFYAFTYKKPAILERS